MVCVVGAPAGTITQTIRGFDSNFETSSWRLEAPTAPSDTLAWTTSGYGPRFLHSTGQLHKGGPAEGVFLQLVQEDATEIAIPGQDYGFSVLKQAQAIGDFRSLSSRRLPVLRVNLGRNHAKGWAALVAAVEAAVGK